jgi:hypothetical protein
MSNPIAEIFTKSLASTKAEALTFANTFKPRRDDYNSVPDYTVTTWRYEDLKPMDLRLL